MQDRFLVKMLENNIEKWVVRLSLRFNDENPEQFKQRVELSKKR